MRRLEEASWPPRLSPAERGVLLRSAEEPAAKATEELEETLAGVVGASHAVAFNSCTSAIHACAAMLGPMRDVRTLAPGFTFAGSWTGPAHLGHIPMFTDVDGSTWNISSNRVRALEREVDIVIAVDLHGVPHDVPRTDVGGRTVITDACQSLGSELAGRQVGGEGLHCWSFSSAKAVPSFAGGAVTVEDADLAGQLRALRDYGIDGSGPRAAEPCIVPFGHNWRITGPDAALAAFRLREASAGRWWIDRMWSIGEELRLSASALGFTVQSRPADARPAWHKVRVGWRGAPLEQVGTSLTRHGVPWHRWGLPLDEVFPWAMRGTRPPLPMSRLVASTTLCLSTEERPFWTWNDREVSDTIRALGRAAEEMDR